MLQEVGIAPQKKSLPKDRWFTDDDFDLFVWCDQTGDVHGFQLCYDKQDNERALTWVSTSGFSHNRIDSGEQLPTRNMTPVLVPDGQFPYERVKTSLKSAIRTVEPSLSELVLQRLKEYSEQGA